MTHDRLHLRECRNDPPEAPKDGEVYGILDHPEGTWSDHAHGVARFEAGAWTFTEAEEGLEVFVESENRAFRFTGGQWRPVDEEDSLPSGSYLRGLVLAVLSGLLFYVSDYPVHAWPLQLVALVPLLFALKHDFRTPDSAAFAGVFATLAYAVPLLIRLDFPLQLAIGFTIYFAVFWVFLALMAQALFRRPGALSALALAAVVAILDWVSVSAFDFWGTAQSFYKVWSAAPFLVQFVSLTGMSGVAFFVVAVQALVLAAVWNPAERRLSLALLGLIAGAVVLTGVLHLSTPHTGRLRVGAIGWTEDGRSPEQVASNYVLFDTLYLPLIDQAAKGGAGLIVTPEFGIRLKKEEKTEFLDKFKGVAKSYGIWLGFAYFDKEAQKNRLAFIGPSGEIAAQYEKTHLIPGIEDYEPGDGTPVLVNVDGIAIGGMICQDDNFRDLSSMYGDAGVQIMAVPTNDWAEVKEYHYENSRFRALENHYGIVRAAMSGTSAIVSPKGFVLAEHDPFTDGPGMIVADLPVVESEALVRASSGPFLLLCLFLAIPVLYRRIRYPWLD